jgi:hypothetical protein
MVSAVSLEKIIQARIEELLEYRYLPIESEFAAMYLDVLLPYLKGDVDELRSRVKALRQMDQDELLPVAELRLQIREGRLDPHFADSVARAASAEGTSPLWRGECAFVAAMAYEQMGDHQKCKDLYLRASQLLEQGGASRKSVRALQNHVAEESRLFPQKRLIPDYNYVYRKAKKVRDYGVAGMALMNISREYQLLKAHSAALKFANRALAYAERERGSRCFYLILAHRCHVLMEMGRREEAKLDFDELKAAPFPEVKAVMEVLTKLFFDPSISLTDGSILPANWSERLKETEAPDQAGSLHKIESIRPAELETTLIQLLDERPRDKFELVSALYGDQIGFVVAENRLKNLLNRVRKKSPGAIVLENGCYRLVQDTLLRKKSG